MSAFHRTLPLRVASGEQLHYGGFASLQQDTFGEVLRGNDIPLHRLGADVFEWKLRPPAGPARVAFFGDEGAPRAGCVMFPVELATGETRARGWHICDAATDARYRGRGLFGRALRALLVRVPRQDWVFAFPNERSRGAFEREGFRVTSRVPLWVRPLRRGASLPPHVAPIASIDAIAPELDDFAIRYAARSGLCALRSASYLRWRYEAHPYFDYDIYGLRPDGSGGRLEGVLVLNRMKARGHVSAWVMELLATSDGAHAELAAAARSLGHSGGAEVLLAMSNLRLPGALRIPSWVLPKPHVLLARRGGRESPRAEAASKGIPWDVHTGDWDTF